MSTSTAALAFSASVFPRVGDHRDPARDAATAKGYTAGYLAGLRAGAAEMEERIAAAERDVAAAAERERAAVDRGVAALAAATAAFAKRTLPLVEDTHASLAAAAVDIAEAVIAAELSDRELSARSVMHRALADVDPATVVAVRMHPGDVAAAERVASIDMATVRLVADATLSAGDAVVELPDGFLDARIDSAVARVRAALVDPS